MSKIINTSYRRLLTYYKTFNLHEKRTFLSNAYYCNEVWNSRLKTPIIQKVNLDDLYQELDNNFNKTKNISAVDVDIFANSVQDESHIDELLDLVHKLRLSADTSNNLPSTEHAVIRTLTDNGQFERLLNILDDRLNYGVFLDMYTANLLFDTFWKKQDYTAGAKVASQIMLQEDFNHPLVTYFSLLHCFKYLQDPKNWEEPKAPEEPEDEIKIRVKYLRNPYFDDHFDLKNPSLVVGKTLTMASENLQDPLSKSFKLLGLSLYQKIDKAKQFLQQIKTEPVISEIINLIPDDNEIKKETQSLKSDSINVQEYLENKIKEIERKCSEKDINDRCELYDKWIKIREDSLHEQSKRLDVARRLEDIKDSQEKLKEKEKLLWYFDNQEQIELEIEGKKVFYRKRWFGKKKKPRQKDEGYVPPDVHKTYAELKK